MQIDDALTALGYMTPRRFELLLVCASLAEGFSASDVRERATGTVAAGSLLRDLLALETGGWLVADPPHTEKRQGRTVTYSVARGVAGAAFHVLASELDAALTTAPEPSSTDRAAPPGA